MNETELAWAAGFFDGEGWSSKCSVSQRSGWRGHYPRLGLTQKDPRPLERFHRAIGGLGSIHGPRKLPPHTFGWQAVGRPAREAMALLSPLLSQPKLEQWERMMALIAQEQSRTQALVLFESDR